jgi:FkbM family methyltransferase
VTRSTSYSSTLQRLAANALRPLKRVTLWLAGQREVYERLDRLDWHLTARLDGLRQDSTSPMDLLSQQIAARLDRLDAQVEAMSGVVKVDIRNFIREEVDRLDSYLVHHATQSRLKFAALLRQEVAELVRQEVAKLTPMIAELEQRIPARPLVFSGAEMDALLLAEGFDLVVPTRELGLLSYLTRHGTSEVEPAVRAALRRHLRPGMVAVDAGANIGLHSLVMAHAVGPEGRIIAFEPLPHLAEALSRSLLLNGFSARCDVVPAALAEGQGEAILHAAAHSPVSSLFEVQGSVTEAISVRRTSLDAYIPPGGRLDLVKLDIEGAEPLAWVGMTRVVAENPGLVIVLEWSASHFARSHHDAATFMAALRAVGFSPWLLQDEAPDAPTPFDPADAPMLEGGNLLLLRST